MRNDRTTLNDLSVFVAEEGSSIFGLLSYTSTQAGKDYLRRHIENLPADYVQLYALQQVVRYLSQHIQWPEIVTNGTLVMLDKFFDAADTHVTPPGGASMLFGKYFQKLLNKSDYFFTEFSLSHLSDFFKGCKELTSLLEGDIPPLLRSELEKVNEELQQRLVDDIIQVSKDTPYRDLAMLNFKARRELKNPVQRLIQSYSKLDAWHAMAVAGVKHNWVFPELIDSNTTQFEFEGLYHPLLKQPQAYDYHFTNGKNFMLLTGANMSGKTTFMRALGVGALLAHLGMAVPAKSMRISFLQGIITNMHVEDDIMKGESYFFAEVQRMKATAKQLLQNGSHLVLMDELFKGTNVHDAYECTRAVIEGLLLHPHHIMVLSTHLHEVAQHFSNTHNINFAYFVTDMSSNEQFRFTYELKEGISNDRIGYRILQKEGVIDLLQKGRSNA
jgi:DNA mismatch repair protein MutS